MKSRLCLVFALMALLISTVAVGTASGVVEKRPYHGETNIPNDEEYTMKLSSFRTVSPPITASEVKEITGINYRFMQTMFGVDEESGQKLLHRCKEKL